MRGTRLALVILLAATAPAVAVAQGPDTLTPDGPATLYSDWHGGQTDEGLPPAVLTAFTVTVAPGGRAGTVRLRVHDREGIVREAAPVTLPAEPGTYTFPAPHIPYDYRDVTLGLDQETGGHAIAAQIACNGDGADFCNAQSVDVYRPVLGAGVMPDRRLAEVLRGRKLTIDAVSEPDNDGDLAGDETEDRTNLRSTMAVERIGGRRLRATITVVNAGPRTADRPRLTIGSFPQVGLARWEQRCRAATSFARPDDDDDRQICGLEPLAVGETRAVSFLLPDPGRIELYGSAKAEGPDLAGGDESVNVERRGARPPVALEVDATPSIARGLHLRVRSARAGLVRLRLATPGRTWADRVVRFKRGGVRRVTLPLTRSQRDRLLPRTGDATLTARSRSATFSVTVHPSY